MSACNHGAPWGECLACANLPVPLPDRPPRRILEGEITRRSREAIGKLPYVALFNNPTGELSLCNGCKQRACPRCAAKFAHPFAFGLCKGSSDTIGMVQCTVSGGAYDAQTGEWEVHNAPPVLLARFFALEFKIPGKKPTPDQVAFIDLVNTMGGYAGWCDSVDGALAHVEAARWL